MKLFLAVVGLSVVGTVALAQSPYAGMQTRAVKSLSEQQVGDLTAGRGMGLALPAELNGYPGPSHVLELSDKLGLSADQKTRVEILFAAMKAEAVPLGRRLLDEETALDVQFAARSITPQSLQAMTAQIGQTQAELRDTHLKYHLQTVQILSTEQVQHYSTLRGYTSDAAVQHHHPMR